LYLQFLSAIDLSHEEEDIWEYFKAHMVPDIVLNQVNLDPGEKRKEFEHLLKGLLPVLSLSEVNVL